MHFHSLVAVRGFEIEKDPEGDERVAQLIKEAEEESKQNPDNLLMQLRVRELRGIENSFARDISGEVDQIMAPYSSEENEYTEREFEDMTESLRNQYLSDTADCIRLPGGKIVDAGSYPYDQKYVIQDGKVCERNAGPLHHAKRTRKTRKMKALPKLSLQKLYKNLDEYATEGCGYTYDSDNDGYGCYYNPNSMWDWYVIGGRWPTTFLVKSDCAECASGERSWGNDTEKYPCPEGYMWVSAARKKDIQWAVMLQWNIERATESFHRYEKMFESQKLDDMPGCNLTERGITHWGELIYRKGETLEEFLKQCHCQNGQKYPVYFSDLISDEDWQSSYGVEKSSSDANGHSTWENMTEDFIDDLEDEDILVSVDYHM